MTQTRYLFILIFFFAIFNADLLHSYLSFMIFFLTAGTFLPFLQIWGQFSGRSFSVSIHNFALIKTSITWLIQQVDVQREEKFLSKKDEAGKAYFKKRKKWKLDAESTPRRVQRICRALLRPWSVLPYNSFSLNLEILQHCLKLVLFFFIPTFINFNSYLCIYLYAVTLYIFYLTLFRLTLREHRFWWWRPWLIFFHIYVYGFKSFRLFYFLFFFLLQINFFFLICVMLAQFFFWKARQPFVFIFLKEVIRISAIAVWCYIASLEIWKSIPKRPVTRKRRKSFLRIWLTSFFKKIWLRIKKWWIYRI